MTDIMVKISDLRPNLPKKLATVAKFALDNPERMAFNTMRTIATECGVTSPTIMRLAHQLGFESYDKFRESFQSVILRGGFGAKAGALNRSTSHNQDSDLLHRLESAALSNISTVFSTNDPVVISEMARVIRESKTTHVVGAGSMHWIAAMMENTGSIAMQGLKASRAGNATVVETFASLTKHDAILIIAIAPYAKNAIQAARYAKECGATVMIVTDKRSSPLLEFSDFSLITPTGSPHYYPSIVGVTILMETLLATVVAESDTTVLEQIDRVEQLRLQSGAYIA